MSTALFDVGRIAGPNPESLLRTLARQIDDDMLHEMAAADYGMDIEAHLEPLRGLRDRGKVPIPFAWEPREVLELIRWSEPDDPEWGPGGHGVRGHWMRAFACTALLRCEFDAGNMASRADGQNQTLAALLTSLDTLAAGLELEAAGLVAWSLERMQADSRAASSSTIDEDLPFFGVGLLWLALRLKSPVSDPAIVDLCKWIAASEAVLNPRRSTDYGLPPGRWLLSTTYFNLNHAKWRAIAAGLASTGLDGRSAEASEWVHLLGAMICEE